MSDVARMGGLWHTAIVMIGNDSWTGSDGSMTEERLRVADWLSGWDVRRPRADKFSYS